MSRKKHTSKAPGRNDVVPAVGMVGLSLSLAGGASAATAPAADVPSQDTASRHEISVGLHEEEIADISLATFYVFDKENAGLLRGGEKLAGWGCRVWWGCRGCRCGCRGCRGCRCGGCRGCGGCRC